MTDLTQLAGAFATLAWGPWLLALLLGGGLYFLVMSRGLPFARLPEAWQLLRGKHSETASPGELSHFQALSSALSGTIGMGNIAGVALAIVVGGPGAVFWMWVTAILGIATKFFTCSLAVMYRGTDSLGQVRGGPMYVIRAALPAQLQPLATLFAAFGLIGCLPAFQTNQLVQVLREVVFVGNGWLEPAQAGWFNLSAGVVLALLTGTIILGGLHRIARVATWVVPTMSVLYLGAALLVLLMNAAAVPGMLLLIFTDAFTGEAVLGGTLAAVITTGVQRGAFSNEAGIGTEALAHGAARTREPIREGLVAMLGPIVDTLLICTATALVILVSGEWQHGDANGVTLTTAAFASTLGPAGEVVVLVCVVAFASTTIATYSWYGSTCFGFLFGAERENWYRWFFVAMIVAAAVVTLETAIGIIDGCFAIMAIPTMVSAIWLAPRVMAEARRYWQIPTRS